MEMTSSPDEGVRNSNCNKCPSCVQIRNINEYSHEAVPLLASNVTMLRDARLFDKILIFIFILILMLAAGLGIYLLFIQSEDAIIQEIDFVSREKWTVNNTFLKDVPPLHTPVTKILLIELITNCTDITTHCLEYEEFRDDDDNKAKMKIFSGQVLYNFYLDRFGRIFEGRGWNFQSDCGQHKGCADVLTIGILEDRNIAPTTSQILKLKAFLDYGITDNALSECYEIVVSHSSPLYFDDLASSLSKINRRRGACKYYF